MKRLVSVVLALCFIIAAGLYTVNRGTGLRVAQAPVPSLKPRLETKLPRLNLDISNPIDSGHYKRLSLDEFLAKAEPSPENKTPAPRRMATYSLSPQGVVKPTESSINNTAPLESLPRITLNPASSYTAQHTSLPSLPRLDQNSFIDRVVDVAEASPLQPDSRNCGTLQHNSKAKPKHAKVKSVAMQRQLTEHTSVGVEYVYKDGCYKNAIAPLNITDMPGDDGVNFRVNMRF